MPSDPNHGPMAEAWIGAGGWAYFRGPNGHTLEDYARAFRFVEVNATFYRHPALSTVRRWRRSVPASFQFAVKAHRDVSPRGEFRATRRAIDALTRSAIAAETLGSDLLVLQTPSETRFGGPEAKALRDLASTISPHLRIALEARAYRGRALPHDLAAALEAIRGVDVVDVSRGETPRVESDVLYTRLFGAAKGNAWEFSDDELRAIRTAGDTQAVKRTVFTFHGVKMYKDAARFVTFRATGGFPPATEARGVDGVREVLAPDARFPLARAELLRDHGWKVVARQDGQNVHVEGILSRLPERPYESLEEVVRCLHGGASRS